MALPIRESGILSMADLVARILGLLFLSRFLTEMGLGASASFRILLPLIGVAASFGSIGVPQALTRLFAGGHGNWRTAWWSTVAAAGVSVAGLGALAWVAVWQSGHNVEGIVRVTIAAVPLLVLTCVNGSLRGILFGLGRTMAPALAQVLEIGTRLWVLTYIWPLLKSDLPTSGAQVGLYVLTTGEVAAMVFLGLALWTAARRARGRVAFLQEASPYRLRSVLRMACAPAGQALFASLGYAMELPLAEAWIAQTHGVETAKHLIADYSAVALPLLCAPMVLTDGLATALLPAESAGRGRTEREESRTLAARRASLQLRRVIGAVALIAVPATAALLVLAPVLTQTFGSSTAADLLVKLAPLTLPLYLQAPLASLLQAHGRSRSLLFAGMLGDGARLGALYFAIQSLHLTRAALPLAFAASVCVQTGLLLLGAIKLTSKRTRTRLPWRTLIHSAGAALPLTALLLLGLHGPHPFLWCLPAVAAAFLHLRWAGEVPPLPHLLRRFTEKEHP
ncbi:hypothetical protein JJB07_08420 [Tumebacillus sp. ITR2]|uniref:Polysaccharide biosynthesis protein C-terminal domain-containing protein n=1 Tax=Tumebacillus amylolyticus TaxID=2801339 RepID=A0ABS1J9F5_9BACL|nr:hypothetical protein [Tumebacillus amylolyticus]MBL0386674.1 hypothetical protein [Tumebacillus amylolyticus]